MNKPRILGITRVRNESHIIGDVLAHVSKLVDGIVVLDDCSQDDTFWICISHPKVIRVIKSEKWDPDPRARMMLEGLHRKAAYDAALEFNPDWIYCFDGDEFASFEGIDFKADAYKLRLFDYYITEADKDENYKSRTKIGPEYRDITMLFRPHKNVNFTSRVPKLPKNYKVVQAGEVEHYGKAISVEEWEKTCQYYMNHLSEKGISRKWTNRQGKAVHTLSDFGAPLITWDERKEKGFLLIDNQRG